MSERTQTKLKEMMKTGPGWKTGLHIDRETLKTQAETGMKSPVTQETLIRQNQTEDGLSAHRGEGRRGEERRGPRRKK